MTNPSSGARLRAGNQTERHTLANGLVVRLTPARDLPYAVLILALPIGLSREPAQQAGLASVTAELLARGHDGQSREQVAEAIDLRGAHFSVRQGRDAVILELRLLSKDLVWGLELLAGMLQIPNLDPDEYAKVQIEAVGAAQSREEEPRDKALELFGRALMGDHPYGRHVDGTSTTLETLTWEQARDFYRQHYGPRGGVICLVGDVEPEDMLAAAERLFGRWSGGRVAPAFHDAPAPRGPVLAADSMPIEQAKLVLGFPSIARNDPDYYALLVMNYIFGGAFRSRLTQNLRAARGLAYSVGSGFSAGKVRGSLRIGIQTGNEQAVTAVAEILKEVERIKTHPVSAKELSEAQHALLGGYPLRIDTLPKIAALSVETEVYGLPEDHLGDFRRNVSGLTAADLTRVARRLFLPGHLAVGMVADLEKAALSDLESLWPTGPVEDVTVGPTEGTPPSPQDCIFSRPEREESAPVQAAALVRGERLHEATLANGLKVLLLESHKAPVATVQVWYGVGSRNEGVGLTGMSHFLEHMMFRGSPRFPDGRFDEVLALNGGTNNAFTTEDYTAYYESMAAGSIDFALELESDRMRSLMFTPEAFYRERDVVVEERRLRVEDSPTGMMLEQLNATAFVAHPYRWPVIGWMSDVAQFTPEDMVAYYRTYYHPGNAILVVAGDLEPERTLNRVSELFSGIPSGPPAPPVRTQEPRQQGERRFEVHKKAGHGSLLLGYHTPNLRHPDSYALEILALLLAGGDSARLPTELVFNRQLALSAWTYYDPVVFDSSLFMIGAEYTPDTDSLEVEQALLAELGRLADEPIGETELLKAVNQWEADFVMKQDDVEDLAVMVGAFATCDHWRHLVEDADKIRAVTAADVQRVARAYFTATNRTLGRLIPSNPSETT